MNGLRKISSYLIEPFILAVLPTVVLIFFIPLDFFSKYKLSLDFKRFENVPGTNDYYVDLNSDGLKEQVETYFSTDNKKTLSFLIYDLDHGLNGQHNFKNGTIKLNNNLYFGDWDNNQLSEIYGFTLNKDSLYINWIEPFGVSKEYTKYITQINADSDGNIKCTIDELHCIDLNRDGYNEIIFPITTGFGLIFGVGFKRYHLSIKNSTSPVKCTLYSTGLV